MAEDSTTEQRLDHIEQAMVYFNRRQNEDLALSQEMRLDFLQEFKAVQGGPEGDLHHGGCAGCHHSRDILCMTRHSARKPSNSFGLVRNSIPFQGITPWRRVGAGASVRRSSARSRASMRRGRVSAGSITSSIFMASAAGQAPQRRPYSRTRRS